MAQSAQRVSEGRVIIGRLSDFGIGALFVVEAIHEDY